MRFTSMIMVGLTLAATMISAEAADMRFRWVNYGSRAECGASCPRVIEAQGTIGRDTPAVFADFIRRSGDVPGARRVVLIHSPGGVLRSGMELGMMFRRLGVAVFVGRFADLATLVEAGALDPNMAARLVRSGRVGDRPVSGACVSACVYAFLGGTERIVPTSSRLGVHRPFRAPDRVDVSPALDPNALVPWDRRAIEDVQRIYIETMGADPALIQFERGTPSERIRFLSAQEMRRMRITTRGR
jgi:hypothetical protein